MNQSLVYSWKESVSRLSIDNRWEQTTKYLTTSEQINGLELQRIWEILDEGWQEVEERIKNKTTKYELLELLHEYYQHPVWLINAAFSESDEATISDRLAAVRLISHVQPRKILDFGGGIGTVSRLCSITMPQAEEIDLVDITEFRQVIKQYLADFKNIQVLEQPNPPYDAVICTEVLEHLTDPVEAIIQINQLLRTGGAFSASWSFGSCIKCHLPQNFHLRRFMLWIIRSLGFGFYGFERRGSTVYGFVKTLDVTPQMIKKARVLELCSRLPIPLGRLMLMLRGM
ncbi:MAG: class I SAM-dependent methyltransferase [Pseudanabaena sp. ELA645]|jgi:2-polyprenyl-3-methyl-5-hydroxy-6-metoxy-1,4-benzoquinol methylase